MFRIEQFCEGAAQFTEICAPVIEIGKECASQKEPGKTKKQTSGQTNSLVFSPFPQLR
ncbi:MAG: Uncharacterised protein [Flavobacteriia bacterium]|nr:MAG: Uncharacterised protein [Flavobacteriia bacterium]